MHPFPHVEELQFLLGAELAQICLGRWQIHLNFDKVNVLVAGALEHVVESGTLHRHNTDADRHSPSYLHLLVGQVVQSIEVEPYRLSLALSGGDIVRILRDDGPYECGEIYNDKVHIIF